ncbi:hypothetical protein D8674_023480 [Pyrus ussuriensis x Pyrus communis]|uniref:Uncharacterized protein n=1 Tax=Pyrus ussuriensis x Pyrus communis TaxID=2448454 RepID=A0A5N5H127_9ROSA|nr:hypothetical protein D8674_023480 [Pyrus ussuriensis x Pyrus communis]
MAQLLKVPAIPFPPSLRRNSSGTSSLRFHIATTMVFTKHDARNTTKPSSFRSTTRNLPIILFDIMDTVVRDPFYRDVPAFFGMSFDELIECKHPTAWIEFEKGITDEVELARTFLKDGRPLDLEGLKNCLRKGYYYVEGVEELLYVLKDNNYEMHMIKDKLNISKYLSWTFCSCINGKRKPDPEFYLEVVSHLKVDPGSFVFIHYCVSFVIYINCFSSCFLAGNEDFPRTKLSF